MTSRRSWRPLALVAVLTLLLSACGHSPVPREHSLPVPSNAEARSSITFPEATVVITSCVVPASIDRPQLVLTTTDGATRIVEAERWSEPLKRAIPRVIATSLMDRLPAVAVWSSGAAGPSRPDARLDIEIIEWRSELGGTVSVDVLWHLRRGDDSRAGRAQSHIRAADVSYPSLVAAHRNAIAAVTEDIAHALDALLRKPPR